MQSTLIGKVPNYLGADLTDRYSIHCRDVDVCGLMPGESGKLHATFWYWRWDPAPNPLDVSVIANELAQSKVSMVDGPQALAIRGNPLRSCERQSAAVGKTPDARPALSKPFAGFICSSLDLFNALYRAGTRISPPGFIGGVSEVYPGHIWTILASRRVLPQKSSTAGRAIRKRILEALGVAGLPFLPTHDQNDACVAALVAAAMDGKVPGVSVESIGYKLLVDIDGTLREGPMVIPQLTAGTAGAISDFLSSTPRPEVLEAPSPAVAHSASGPSHTTADALLSRLIAKAVEGDPRVCTYALAYHKLFNNSYPKWSQAYTNRVIQLARRTTPQVLPGLGPVRLDAFIVSKQNGLPGDGYWPLAQHDREDWERVLGDATPLD